MGLEDDLPWEMGESSPFLILVELEIERGGTFNFPLVTPPWPPLDKCLVSQVFGCSQPVSESFDHTLDTGSRMELTLEGSAKRMGSGTEVHSYQVRVTCSIQYGLKVRDLNLSSIPHTLQLRICETS
jgi:hypothetical protein